MHPKYIKVINFHNNTPYTYVSIKVLKTNREYRLYDTQAIRFIKHYDWSAV